MGKRRNQRETSSSRINRAIDQSINHTYPKKQDSVKHESHPYRIPFLSHPPTNSNVWPMPTGRLQLDARSATGIGFGIIWPELSHPRPPRALLAATRSMHSLLPARTASPTHDHRSIHALIHRSIDPSIPPF